MGAEHGHIRGFTVGKDEMLLTRAALPRERHDARPTHWLIEIALPLSDKENGTYRLQSTSTPLSYLILEDIHVSKPAQVLILNIFDALAAHNQNRVKGREMSAAKRGYKG